MVLKKERKIIKKTEKGFIAITSVLIIGVGPDKGGQERGVLLKI